jgi:hypothetical protein
MPAKIEVFFKLNLSTRLLFLLRRNQRAREHSRLKQMFAELGLENQALKDVIAKKLWSFRLFRGQ